MVKVSEFKTLKRPQSIPLHAVFGNDMDSLSHRLGEEIFLRGGRPFEDRLIVVPDLSIKEYLIYQFVSHPLLKMAAGVRILPLNQAVMGIIDQVSEEGSHHQKIPSVLELSLAIEEKLYGSFSQRQGSSPLLEYIGKDLAEKKRKKIAFFSDELAKLFGRYGLYGASFLPKWLNQENQGWQQSLWRDLFSDESGWTYPLKALNSGPFKPFSGQLYLFGFSYICPVHLSFFASLGASLYQLSPCALFWQDLTSDKQRMFASRTLRKKGVKETVRREMEEYMQQGHPLLGNWGKMGRELLKSLAFFELVEEEIYQEPAKETLLGSLKRSMLSLDADVPMKFDDSIQLHSATSRLREVEILRDVLESLVQSHTKENDPILPSDILVLCPEVSDYAPYIQTVFAQSAFPFTIKDIPILSFSQSVQGFFQLLKMKQERFAFSAVSKLLQCIPFLEKNGFSFDEVGKIEKWLKSAEICEKLSAHPNSWESGLDRLVLGMAVKPNLENNFDSWPISCIPQSEIECFSRFIELFQQIVEDLALFDGEKSAREWLESLLQIADKYFQFECDREPFFQDLGSLARSCHSFKAQIWNFENIERILTQLAARGTGEISSSQVQKMTIMSSHLASIRTARIIWCMGMDEESFPRSDTKSSLCEMSRLNASDYYPGKTDEDRALFLDLLLKAKDYLIFSYQRISPEDGNEQSHSVLIEELRQFLISQGPNEGIFSIDHPAFPFDSIYFSSEKKIRKWSNDGYLAAKAYYSSHEKAKTAPFFNLSFPSLEDDQAQEIIIDIRQLKKLARSPLQFYFNESLKIYLEKDEDEEEKEFLLSNIRKSALRKKAIKKQFPKMIKMLRASGQLPRGLFQEVACQELEEEVQNLIEFLAASGVHPDDVYSVHLSLSCLDQERNETFLPPLKVSFVGNRTAYIIGKLEDITPNGLLFHSEKDLKGLVRAWPLYLIYLSLKQGKPKLLLTKKNEELDISISNPEEALSSYLEYFLIAKKAPSPLMPDWAAALLNKTEDEFVKAVSKEAEFDDAYLNYLLRRQDFFDPKEIFRLWSDPLRKIFNPLIEMKDS